MERKRVLELDKICRVCTSERKDMRPLYSEKVAEMLMEFAAIKVEPTEGWPDKICVQCVHQVSRCHAFKGLVERNDKELREYIKSLTVRVVIDDAEQQRKQQLLQEQQLQLQREHEIKLQKSQAKLLLLQKQQQALQQQQLEQEQRILQEQQQQKELLEKRNASLAARKAARKKLQEEKEKQKQMEQQKMNLQSQNQPTAQQILLGNNNPSLAQAHNPNALPQQVLVSNNGQIILTTQNASLAGNVANNQNAASFASQLIPTNSGQTLQIIQQPNGQHTLQLVQLVPQRTLGQTNLATATQNIGNIVALTSASGNNDDSDAIVNLVEDSNMGAEDEDHLLDDDDNELVHADNEESGMEVMDTIIIKDETLTQHSSTQNQLIGIEDVDYDNQDSEELEYLEDITVSTTGAQQSHHQHLQQLHVMQVFLYYIFHCFKFIIKLSARIIKYTAWWMMMMRPMRI